MEVCNKLILLNRNLHGCWFSYKGKLPDIFLLVHPIGTILGNATYSNKLVIMQGVTVNSAFDEEGRLAPKIGENVYLSAGAKIIGNKQIGDNVTIGVDTVIHNQEVLPNTLVYTDENGKRCVKTNHRAVALQYFK